MDGLPTDLLPRILGRLPASQVGSLATVSHSYHGASQDAQLWRALAAAAFGVAASDDANQCKRLFQSKAWTRANWRSPKPSTKISALAPPAAAPNWRTWFATALAQSPAGVIACGGTDGTIRLWRVGADGNVPLGTLHGHSSSISALAIDKDAHFLCSGAWDKTIRVWDLRSQEAAPAAPLRQWKAHGRAVMCLMLHVDPQRGRTTLVSGGGDGRVCFWNVTGEGAESAEAPPAETAASEEAPVGARTGREDWPVMVLRAAPTVAGGDGAVGVDAAYADGSVRRWQCGRARLDADGNGGAAAEQEEEELVPVLEEEIGIQSPSTSRPSGPLERQPGTVAVALVGGQLIEASRSEVRSRPRAVTETEGTAGAATTDRAENGPTAGDAAVAALAEWAWDASASMGAVTCLEANAWRVAAGGVAKREGGAARTGGEQAAGLVSVLSPAGELLHTVALASPPMSMRMSETSLLIGCKDGTVRCVDYTMSTEPPRRPPQQSSLVRPPVFALQAWLLLAAVGALMIALAISQLEM